MSGWMAAAIGALATLAAAALAWLIVWLVKRRQASRRRKAWGSSPGNRGAQDIQRLFRDAEEKLRRSPDLRARSIRDLPVYLFIGDQGSGKTSLIFNSGLQAELLAGQNRPGSPIARTDTLNILLIAGSVVIEAPAHIWKDEALATALLGRLRHPAFSMMFGNRRRAARAVVACIAADQLGSNAALASSIDPLNQFLLLASRQLGIALPVYAVFTRADGIKGFREIFFNLNAQEAGEVLGMSLDADQLTDRASYSALAPDTLNAECKRLIAFLQTRRTSLLVREYELERAWAGYEFPRRLDRARPSLVKALVDLCKPSLIQTSPVLRGFYFTGVRRTLRQEGSSQPGPVLSDQNDILNATRMFRPGAMPMEAPRPSRSEEVDEWAFSRRLLRDVIFADSVAGGISGESRFRDVYRAALCWAGAGLAFALIGCELVSYIRNANLERSLSTAAAQVRQPAGPRLVAALEEYRPPVDRLLEYRDDVPTSLRWGLFQGHALFPPAKRQFCMAVKTALVDSAVLSIQRQLRQGKGGAEYDALYRMLKAELTMSWNPEYADPDFLPAELAAQAAQGGQIARGSESAVLPFLRTYARLLRTPEERESCLVKPDPAVIAQARAYLKDASADDKIYSDLLSKAGRGLAPVNYNAIHPNEAVRDSFIVPGAFTSGAWNRMQAFLNQPDKLISTEGWVLGETAAKPIDTQALSARLRVRYSNDFAGKWREYLNQGSVAHYASLDDAARKLDIIAAGGNQSAILWLFNVATGHTGAGEPVASAFQPVREVVAKTDDFAAGMPYIADLTNIKVLLTPAARLTGPPRDQAFDQIRQAATQARKGVEQTALKFRTADVGAQVRTLLLQPIAQVEDLLNAQGAKDLASAGAGLCGPYQGIYSKFPFQMDATADADPEEVLRLLKPNDGPIFKFYSTSLADSLDQSDAGFAPKLNPRVQVRREFIDFMNHVQAQSRIFYATPDDPGFRLNLRAVPNGIVRSIDIYIDDQHYPLAPGGATTINWSLRRSRRLRLELQFAGIQEPPQTLNGPWALLRWLYSAEHPSVQPLDWILRSGKLARTMDNGTPITYRLDVRFADNSPFDSRKLAALRCVAPAAK